MQELDPLKTFAYSPWWDPTVKVVSLTRPLIHQRIQELRRAIGGVEAVKAAFVPFPVKSAKELEQKLQPALDKVGLSMACTYDVHNLEPSSIPITKKKSGEDIVVRSACWVVCTVRLCAEDGSYLDSQGAGGGFDGDDKALGKATTYSRKDAILKMLAVPEKNMIDTDDEVEAGAKPKDMGAAIAEAPDKAALEALLPALKALPTAKQLALSKPYNDKMKSFEV